MRRSYSVHFRRGAYKKQIHSFEGITNRVFFAIKSPNKKEWERKEIQVKAIFKKLFMAETDSHRRDKKSEGERERVKI